MKRLSRHIFPIATRGATRLRRSARAEGWYKPKAKVLTIFRKSGTLVARLRHLATLEERFWGRFIFILILYIALAYCYVTLEAFCFCGVASQNLDMSRA